MTNGLTRYYTPLCFSGVDALLDGRDRSHSLCEDVRGNVMLSGLVLYTSTLRPGDRRRLEGGGGWWIREIV